MKSPTLSLQSLLAGWCTPAWPWKPRMYWQWQRLALAPGGRAEFPSSLKDSWAWPEWETFMVLNHRHLDIDLKLVTLIQTHYFSGSRSLGIYVQFQKQKEARRTGLGITACGMLEAAHWGIFPVINYHVWPHSGVKLRVTLGFLSFCSLAHSRYSYLLKQWWGGKSPEALAQNILSFLWEPQGSI